MMQARATERRVSVPIEDLKAAAYTVPTEEPESDGTLTWSSTTLVLVELSGGGRTGLGYTYGDPSIAALARERLGEVVKGQDVFANAACWEALAGRVRNLGRPGLVAMAIAAIDAAVWDLKAKLMDVPLAILLGPARARVPIYGSGGFTSYSTEQLVEQLGGWIGRGIRRVKMKVGRDPDADRGRVRAAREAIGPSAALFVDANGAYARKQALRMAELFAQSGVSWFEEPVSSDDLEGLRLLRDRAPAGMDIAAGEYGYDVPYFLRMLNAGAVDVLQADASRCQGPTGFLRAAAVCDAMGIPLSAHTGPMLHLPLCCAVPRLAHLEYFHDHVRVEKLLFDGVVEPVEGELSPDLSRPGFGLELKRQDAARYQV
jgi:L-alanine-DL-glutamate epimerase-like enolase superfamily enzyme